MNETRTESENHQISNQWAAYGAADLVRKVGKGWQVADICKHPGRFATKREAVAAVNALVLSV